MKGPKARRAQWDCLGCLCRTPLSQVGGWVIVSALIIRSLQGLLVPREYSEGRAAMGTHETQLCAH